MKWENAEIHIPSFLRRFVSFPFFLFLRDLYEKIPIRFLWFLVKMKNSLQISVIHKLISSPLWIFTTFPTHTNTHLNISLLIFLKNFSNTTTHSDFQMKWKIHIKKRAKEKSRRTWENTRKTLGIFNPINTSN